MSWNYRIIEYGEGDCAMHEVHYDKTGAITGWTGLPRQLTGETPEDIIADLELMLSDARRLPPLPWTELPRTEDAGSDSASAIEARSDATGTGAAEGESAAPQEDAQ